MYGDRKQKTARLSQRIDPDLKQRIHDEAERRHLDETAIVTIALTEYFERQEINPADPAHVRLTNPHKTKTASEDEAESTHDHG